MTRPFRFAVQAVQCPSGWIGPGTLGQLPQRPGAGAGWTYWQLKQ